jgi:hypothetical protein
MISKVVVDYRVVDMVCSKEMFEGPGSFLWSCLDVVNLDWWNVDRLSRIRAGCQIPVDPINQRHPSYHWRRHDGGLRRV